MKPEPRLLVAALLAATIAGCDSDGTVVDFENGGKPTTTETTVTGASDAAKTSILNYTMPDINGGNRRENAVVMIPVGETPEGGWPVIGWGHGTVGVADSCAPSATTDLSGYDTYLNTWLAAGYAIVAPDYEGLGSNGGHPYLHLDSEGRSLNYAVDAATEAFPELSSEYALLGHSQGGHAVLGAASLPDENPDITLVGTVALAPASQILAQGALQETLYTNTANTDDARSAAAIEDARFSALIAHGINTVLPSYDLDAVYGSDGVALQALTETTCLPALTTELSQTVPAILQAQNSIASIIAIDEQNPDLLTYFESVEPGSRSINTPVALMQGLSDQTVLPESTSTLQSQLSAVNEADADPVLTTYPATTHSGILLASFNDTIAFIAARFADQ